MFVYRPFHFFLFPVPRSTKGLFTGYTVRHSMTHTNRKYICKFVVLLECAILSIKRTQVNPCIQILSTLCTCLHVMVNTVVKQKEMQTWCQQSTKSSNRWPPQLLLLYLASEHLAEWRKKVSLLCLNTVAGYSTSTSTLTLFIHFQFTITR